MAIFNGHYQAERSPGLFKQKEKRKSADLSSINTDNSFVNACLSVLAKQFEP